MENDTENKGALIDWDDVSSLAIGFIGVITVALNRKADAEPWMFVAVGLVMILLCVFEIVYYRRHTGGKRRRRNIAINVAGIFLTVGYILRYVLGC